MIYRKRGTAVRWENGTVVRVDEEGLARVDGGVFECEPAGTPERDASAFHATDLQDVAARVREAAAGVSLERLVIIDGHASNQYGERRWSESTRRMHVALTRDRLRVMIDLASFETAEVAAAARSLQRLATSFDGAPESVRLAPAVTAALLPFLVTSPPAGARIVQTAGGLDGYGEPIIEAEGDWPNWFRPSYRIAPRRVPMNLRIEAAADTIDSSLPSAVALLAPPHGASIRVLLDDGSRSWPATIRTRSVRAVSRRRIWYPYAAGSFGAEMML